MIRKVIWDIKQPVKRNEKPKKVEKAKPTNLNKRLEILARIRKRGIKFK